MIFANHAIRSLAISDKPVKNCSTPQGKLQWKMTKSKRPSLFETVSRLVSDNVQKDITRSLDAEVKRALDTEVSGY